MLEEYELLIIGGGIIGASCAYEASLRGVKVLLLEKSDFGSKTSQGSFKIVHGGLRYLQHLDYPRLRESVKCQNYIRRFAPHLIRTLPFIVPCYGYGMKGKEILSLACEIYNLLSLDRNKGVSPDQTLPRYKTLSVEELIRIAPHVNKASLRGGVVFFDSQMLDPDRLILQFISSAERHGAYLENYKEVTSITPTSEGYVVCVKDQFSGMTREVKTRYIVNAMGPWASKVAEMFGAATSRKSQERYYSKGIQIGLRDFPIENAISVQSKGIDTAASINRGGRAIFLQPWRDFTLIGTTDTIYEGDPDKFLIEQSEVESLFDELISAYPDPKLIKSKIAFSFGGLRPIDPSLMDPIKNGEDRDGLVNTSRDEDLIDHDQPYQEWGMHSYSNVVTIVGIKYTTSRSVAIRVIDLLSKKGLTTKNRGEDYFNYREIIQTKDQLDSIENDLSIKNSNFTYKVIAKEIWETYGINAKEFLTRINISNVRDVLEIENIVEREMILNAIQNEYAKNMQDVIVRRLSRKLFTPANKVFISRVAEIFRNELGWSQDEISSDLKQTQKIFPI